MKDFSRTETTKNLMDQWLLSLVFVVHQQKCFKRMVMVWKFIINENQELSKNRKRLHHEKCKDVESGILGLKIEDSELSLISKLRPLNIQKLILKREGEQALASKQRAYALRFWICVCRRRRMADNGSGYEMYTKHNGK